MTVRRAAAQLSCSEAAIRKWCIKADWAVNPDRLTHLSQLGVDLGFRLWLCPGTGTKNLLWRTWS
jgi:hypothetical protein